MNKINWKDEKGNDVEFIEVSELIDKILNNINIPSTIRVLKSKKYYWNENDECYKNKNNDILTFALSSKDLNATIEIIHEEKSNLEDVEELDMRKVGNIVGTEISKFMQGFLEGFDENG